MDREDLGQESSLALLEWNVKALEESNPNVQRQVLAIAAKDQPPHFMGPENIQYPIFISDYEFDGTYFFARYGDYLLRKRAYLIA